MKLNIKQLLDQIWDFYLKHNDECQSYGQEMPIEQGVLASVVSKLSVPE